MPHIPRPLRRPATTGVDPSTLFDEVGPVAYGLALRILRDPDDAAEVVRAAFVAGGKPQRTASDRSRVVAEVHRLAVQLLRSRGRQAQPPSATEATPVADVLRLTYLDGLSLREAAAQCGISRAEAAQAVREQLAGPRDATPELRVVSTL